MSQHEPGEPSGFTRPHGLRPLGEPGSIASGAEGSSGSNSGKWTGAVDPGVEPSVDPGVGTSAPVRFAEFPVGTASSKAPRSAADGRLDGRSGPHGLADGGLAGAPPGSRTGGCAGHGGALQCPDTGRSREHAAVLSALAPALLGHGARTTGTGDRRVPLVRAGQGLAPGARRPTIVVLPGWVRRWRRDPTSQGRLGGDDRPDGDRRQATGSGCQGAGPRPRRRHRPAALAP